jgi:alanine racemase
MTLKTHILHIKKIQKGTSVSYGRSFIAEHTTKIATIPIGYADGYNRLLSNNANVLIKGKLYPVVGKVCMDLTMIDIGNDELCIGDQVVLFGRQKNKTISVLNISETLDTIPYEAFCWISKRVKRIYNQ